MDTASIRSELLALVPRQVASRDDQAVKDLSPDAARVWQLFCEISAVRVALGMWKPGTLTPRFILEWVELRERLGPTAELLFALDAAWFAAVNTPAGEPHKAPAENRSVAAEPEPDPDPAAATLRGFA
jgi:hypothetical protein